MDQLFAPWRIDWVAREDRNADIDGCPFCVLPERDDARAARVVAETDHAYVLLNNYPYNPGHAMVIPHTHTGDLRELDQEALLAVGRLQQHTVDAMETAFGPDGFNVGMNLGDAAGGSIGDHVHAHVVPRWSGDTNFMPVLDDTKVIVEAVGDTYDRLYDGFGELEAATVPAGPGPIRL